MFTFGREKEIEVVHRRHGGDRDATQIIAVVNAIHDLLEGKLDIVEVEKAIKTAITEGRRDIWDAAGTWLLKSHKTYPSTKKVWGELAEHPKAEVRFRVASHIIDMPSDIRQEVYQTLRYDKSKKVKEHAEGKWDYCTHPEKYT